jgi:hypothetical protein
VIPSVDEVLKKKEERSKDSGARDKKRECA